MLPRVMPELMGMMNIVVLNDEHTTAIASACGTQRGKPRPTSGRGEKRAKDNNEAARMWISGLEIVNGKLGISLVYDLSATPFFLRGSGYREGTLFPWTMSNFSLMESIECGIVKLPRVPVVDNIPGGDAPNFRNLWETIGKKMPKTNRGGGGKSLDPLSLPVELLTALDALYGHYEKTFNAWRDESIPVPPVFIVVCNNTSTSEPARPTCSPTSMGSISKPRRNLPARPAQVEPNDRRRFAFGDGEPRRARGRARSCATSCLQRAFGLARCVWRGLDHFRAYVWSSVVAYNLAVFARLKPA
jgi:hypothetical protein